MHFLQKKIFHNGHGHGRSHGCGHSHHHGRGHVQFMVFYIFTTLPILGTSSNFVHRLKSIHYLQKKILQHDHDHCCGQGYGHGQGHGRVQGHIPSF